MRTSTAAKNPVRNEGSLIEIQNNLQGNNSRVGEVRIKSVIWNIKKQKTTNQNNKKKKESQKKRIV